MPLALRFHWPKGCTQEINIPVMLSFLSPSMICDKSFPSTDDGTGIIFWMSYRHNKRNCYYHRHIPMLSSIRSPGTYFQGYSFFCRNYNFKFTFLPVLTAKYIASIIFKSFRASSPSTGTMGCFPSRMIPAISSICTVW